MNYDTGKRMKDVNPIIRFGNWALTAEIKCTVAQKEEATRLYKEVFIPEVKKSIVKVAAQQLVQQGAKSAFKLSLI